MPRTKKNKRGNLSKKQLGGAEDEPIYRAIYAKMSPTNAEMKPTNAEMSPIYAETSPSLDTILEEIISNHDEMKALTKDQAKDILNKLKKKKSEFNFGILRFSENKKEVVISFMCPTGKKKTKCPKGQIKHDEIKTEKQKNIIKRMIKEKNMIIKVFKKKGVWNLKKKNKSDEMLYEKSIPPPLPPRKYRLKTSTLVSTNMASGTSTNLVQSVTTLPTFPISRAPGTARGHNKPGTSNKSETSASSNKSGTSGTSEYGEVKSFKQNSKAAHARIPEQIYEVIAIQEKAKGRKRKQTKKKIKGK